MMEYLGDIYLHHVLAGDRITAGENHLLIPSYGDIPCGPLNFMDDEISGYLEVPNEMLGNGDYFVLRAKGSSMIDAGISDGDLVVVKKQSYAENSQIVVACVEGETTLKRFFRKDDKSQIELRPDNIQYKSIFVSDCIILGVAVKVLKDIQ